MTYPFNNSNTGINVALNYTLLQNVYRGMHKEKKTLKHYPLAQKSKHRSKTYIQLSTAKGQISLLFVILSRFACLVNPIIVDGYASLFNCTTAVRASDSMTASS